MIANASHERPNLATPLAEELVSKLGNEFSDICHWAVENDLQLALEVGYLILGLNPLTVGIGNLVHELSHPESLKITAQWRDNPLAQELDRFSTAFTANPKISRSYSNISHVGGAAKNRRQFGNYKDATFLLTLVTHPLADITDSQTYEDRRRLRIWLLIQAATRLLEFNCPADRSISIASRFLVKDAGDGDWQIVDELLLRTRRQLRQVENTFERFTSALSNAANYLKDEGGFAGKSQLTFLNAVMGIAAGEVHAIEISKVSLHTPPRHSHLRVHEPAVQMGGVDTLNPPAVSALTDVPDEPEFAFVTEIDPTDSPAQQTLSSGSVFIQTMAESHYLPWSWERVLPPEAAQLEPWLDARLTSPEPQVQVGAACAWLAMTLGRSFALVEQLAISPEVGEEWGVSADFQYLQRQSPRRMNGWKPNEQSRELVEPFRDKLIIKLPDRIENIFQRVVKDHGEAAIPENLGQLWRAVSSTRIEVWFNEQTRRDLPRLTSSKLANYQPQRLFNLSGEFSFPRLLTSHPSSALPGACSYASWDIKAIEKGLQLPVAGSAEAGNTHIMGSLLAPLDGVLNAEIQRCTARLRDEAGIGLLQYHNALAQYVLTALYAATGARPLRDPFESLLHFSLERGCVFVNDKSDGGLHNGRLVPLPEKAVTLVKHYVAFLGKLSLALQQHRPELAEKIIQLVNGQRAAGMPLFFLLDSAWQWHSMADAEKLDCALFEWGLPANLFRHRYAQQLLQKCVHPEVIEGWMGHAERGVASYSDYSARCWQVDANDYRHVMEQVFASLPFEIPSVVKPLPPLLSPPAKASSYSEPIRFGQQARERNRRYRLKAALHEAKTDMQLFLNRRLISELDEQGLDKLSSRMLLRENGLPHPQAALRYRTFLKALQREGDSNEQTTGTQEEGKQDASKSIRYTLLNRRLVTLSAERSLVTPDIIQALDCYAELAAWADTTHKAVFKAQLGKAQALCLGTLLLAVEKRLGYQRQLQDVMRGENFRLAQDKNQVYLEYAENLDPDDYSSAIQRHQISYKTASLLAHGIHYRNSVNLPSPTDIAALQPLISLYARDNPSQSSPSAVQVLEWVCKTINLANLIELPGIVAAALSERSPPTSASLGDHTRLLSGRAVALHSKARSEELPTTSIARSRGQIADRQSLQGQAKELTNAITAALQAYVPAQAREHAQNIRTICKDYQGLVSPSILMLGYWIADLTTTGQAPRRKKLSPYARNSLTTYWSSLAPAFRGLLYEIDLVSLDSEELTELSAQMLEYKLQTSTRADYFGKRLQDFFRWAAQFGVASPEWSELALASDHRTVSAGLITETEYQTCLQHIQNDSSLSQDEQLILGFVLLGTYRFGLRAKEAIGLLRRDWCQNGNDIWALVQNSQYRTLKSQASRRAIPLLFELSDIEKSVIEKTLARYSSIAGTVANRPILCEPATTGVQPRLTSLAPRISEALIQLLKGVTCNPDMVLHHCRHTFYNRVAVALLGLTTPLADKLLENEDHQKIRHIVLGPANGVSRRSSMALARLMGHRYPSTGFKSYFHLATDWADVLTPETGKRTHKIQGIFQISKQPTVAEKSVTSASDALTYPTPSLTKVLQTLRLISLGISYERAGELMQIEPILLTLLRHTFELTNSRMRFTSPANRNVKIKGTDHPNALLESISSDAWQRLLSKAESIGVLDPIDLDSAEQQHLDELPYLISPNRHFLMEQMAHCKLIKHAIEIFEIPKSQYKIVVKNNSEFAMEVLIKAGFDPCLENKAGLITDGFTAFLTDRGNQYQVKHYGALVLSRSANGVIRNGMELAVAFLAIGVLLKISKINLSD